MLEKIFFEHYGEQIIRDYPELTKTKFGFTQTRKAMGG